MSAVGFAPLPSEDPELENLREACKKLNHVLRAIKDAQDSLSVLNLGTTRDRLNNAQSQAREAKRIIAAIGKAKPGAKRKSEEREAFHDTRRRRDDGR